MTEHWEQPPVEMPSVMDWRRQVAQGLYESPAHRAGVSVPRTVPAAYVGEQPPADRSWLKTEHINATPWWWNGWTFFAVCWVFGVLIVALCVLVGHLVGR